MLFGYVRTSLKMEGKGKEKTEEGQPPLLEFIRVRVTTDRRTGKLNTYTFFI